MIRDFEQQIVLEVLSMTGLGRYTRDSCTSGSEEGVQRFGDGSAAPGRARPPGPPV